MIIRFFCPRWGAENISWEDFCRKVKHAGYHGIEFSLPLDKTERDEIVRIVRSFELDIIAQYYQSFENDFEIHKSNYIKHIEQAIDAHPLVINCQTGKDYFTAAQNAQLFDIAYQITNRTGIPVIHETHRNKALFAAHAAKQLLLDNPHVQITADFSHWCNVSESLLEQQPDALDIAIDRAIHIHARVGHAESAQVSDPRAPEWQTELNAHLDWWDRIVENRAAHDAGLLTITPEFGPAPYMPALPFTKMPVASQWDINIFMMEMLKERYKKWIA